MFSALILLPKFTNYYIKMTKNYILAKNKFNSAIFISSKDRIRYGLCYI